MKEIIYSSKEMSKKEKLKISSAHCTSLADVVKTSGIAKISDIDFIVVLGADDVTTFPTAIIATKSGEKYLISGSVAVEFVQDIATDLDGDFDDITLVFEYNVSKSSGNSYMSCSIE